MKQAAIILTLAEHVSSVMRYLIFFLSFLTQVAFADIVHLTEATERFNLADKMILLKDESANLSISNIPRSESFRSLPQVLNINAIQTAVWLHAEINRSPLASDEWILEITSPRLNNVSLFTREEDGSWREQRAGTDANFRDWEVGYRIAVFHLKLSSSINNEIRLRIPAEAALTTNVIIWKPNYFYFATKLETFIYALFFGIYISFIINFHRMTGDSVSFWFVCYLATFSIVSCAAMGYPLQYLGWSPRIIDLVITILVDSSVWIFTIFSSLQLQLKQKMPHVHSVLTKISAVLSLILISLSFTAKVSFGMLPAQLLFLVWVSLFIFISMKMWLRGYLPAKFLFFYFCIFQTGLLLRCLRNFNFIQSNFILDNGCFLMMIVHLFLMNLSIRDQCKAMDNDKKDAQAVALKAINLRADLLDSIVKTRTASLINEIAACGQTEMELRLALDMERQSRRKKLDFMSMVSHEIRTPLATINTSIYFLEKNIDLINSITSARINNIKEALRQIIKMLDSYTTVDCISGDFESIKSNLYKTLDIVKWLNSEWPSEFLIVEQVNIPENLVYDPQLLQIALRNLIANSLTHSSCKSPIKLIMIGQADCGVCFSVIDDGDGISNDDISKVFDKYFRGQNSKGKSGSGLGLYLVERIALLHRGCVQVESVVGYGARFSIYLPGSKSL